MGVITAFTLFIFPNRAMGNQFPQEVRTQLQEKAESFPLINLKRDFANAPLAKIHPIIEKSVEIDGVKYYGHRFRTPEWFEGSAMLWLFTHSRQVNSKSLMES